MSQIFFSLNGIEMVMKKKKKKDKKRKQKDKLRLQDLVL